MQYEVVCRQMCDDIAALLVDLRPRTGAAVCAAASATANLAAAFHHAAGRPEDARWHQALASLERFLEVCTNASPRSGVSTARHELRRFLEENADVLPSSPQEELLIA
jgi:hypothetical protein